jgi:iron complex outermembrane receptor protein
MSPENTLVVIDGQRVNSYQNGEIDLGFLSSANIQRIEVVKGGYSAIYGAGAVGGVINITTKRPPEGLAASLAQTIGSNGFQGTDAAFGGTIGQFGWQANLRRETGRGNYRYFFDDGKKQTDTARNGNDFQLLDAQVRLEWADNNAVRVFASAGYSDASRGVASPVTDLSTVSRARLGDKTLRATAGGECSLASGLSARLTGMFFYSEEQYADPSILINGSLLQSAGTNRAVLMTPEICFVGSPELSGSLGFEYGRAWYHGSDLLDANRYQQSVYLTTQHTVDLKRSVPFEVNIFPSLRYDHFSDTEGDVSPRIGVNVGLFRSPEIRLRSSYGKSFRVPTFNDLYWIAGGNAGLKPERSLSFDGGLLVGLDWMGGLALDVSYFNIRTRDRIVWTPTSGTFWSPVNLSEVSSRGIEVEGNWTGLERHLLLTVNSTWNTVTKTSEDFPGDQGKDKQLVYVPKQTLNAIVTLKWDELSIYLQESWTSFRYTTEFNDRFLPSYTVASAALRYGLPLGSVHGFIKLEATNIFNSRYQVIALYPMPLRELKFTLGGQL